MYPPPKRRWPGLVGAYLSLMILLAVPSVPISYYVEPAYKLLVIRVCTGTVLAFTLYRLVRDVGEWLEQQLSTGFEAAAQPPAEGLSLAPHFEKLRDEVTHEPTRRTRLRWGISLRGLRVLVQTLKEL
jgi:hypothetical protein